MRVSPRVEAAHMLFATRRGAVPPGAHAVAIGTALGSFPFTLPDGTCDRDNAGSYVSSARRLSVRSCSITTGRPVTGGPSRARAPGGECVRVSGVGGRLVTYPAPLRCERATVAGLLTAVSAAARTGCGPLGGFVSPLGRGSIRVVG